MKQPAHVNGLVNDSSNVVTQYSYTARGALEPAIGTVTQPLGYMAREYDETIGLYNVRARWYDPHQGRFVSEDPIGLAGGMNPYAYVNNSPVNLRDPEGLNECEQALRDQKGPDGKRVHTSEEMIKAICGTGAMSLPGVGGSGWRFGSRESGASRMFGNRNYGIGAFANTAATAVVGFGDGASFGVTIAIRGVIGGNENVSFDSPAYLRGAVIGAFAGAFLQRKGAELKLGKDFRLAPYGNRTDHPTGRYPHYHRRIKDEFGNTVPGGGIGRHRPYDPPAPGTPWYRRF